MEELIKNLIVKRNKQLCEIYESYLRTLAIPPIKGDITKGKLSWRGITRVVHINPQKEWLEQRGKRITPIITDDCMMLHSPKINQ